jgi:dihydroxyacetone kinase-like predicted kinase
MPPPATVVDSTLLRGWAATGRDALEAAREEIDELNVYPVPDGDTGTNLHLTVEAAALTLSDLPEDAAPAETLATLARGALLGARGNSGVILSQVLRGLADSATMDAGELGAVSWAAALTRGAEAAYAAVGEPVEGTMLTVLREAAAAATAGASDGGQLTDVVRAAAVEAAAALARTPEQLEVLACASCSTRWSPSSPVRHSRR